MKKLNEDEYKLTFGEGMTDVTGCESDNESSVVDIWSYVEEIAENDWCKFEQYEEFVDKVYRNDRYDHVLAMTKTNNVYMVIVVDRELDSIHGHYLLDLNEKYGLSK